MVLLLPSHKFTSFAERSRLLTVSQPPSPFSLCVFPLSQDVSEKRFDREVQSANIMRELRRRREFECTQTQKKRKIEEKKMRRRASFRGGRRFSRDPVSWENYFGT